MRKLLFILPLLTLTVFAAATRFQYFETWSTKLSNQDLTISPSGTGVLSISSDATMTSTGALKVPVGTEAQRPTGAAGKFRFNSDTSGFEGHDGSTWGPIGGGGGGGTLKIFHQQEFETTVSASDFTCGTSLTAADETTDEIAGDTSLSITQGATPPTVGVECVSPTITLEKGQIDKFFGVDFYTTWTGNDNEMDFVVYDQGNNELVRVPIVASTVPKLHSGYGETLSTSTSIRYEIEVAVQNASDELIIDDIEFKVDPLTPTDIFASSEWEDCGMTASDFSAAFGSVTAIEDICKRDGTDLIINVKFVAGTVTGGAATITPRYNGSTITIDSIVGSNIPSGTHQRDASIVANSGVVLISGGDTFLEFAPTSSTGAGPYTARPADEICITGANCGFEARVPIAGWSDKENFVAIKGSSVNDIANSNIFSADITCSATSSITNENISGWTASITNISAGGCDITLANGMVSNPMNCSLGKNSAGESVSVTSETATGFSVVGVGNTIGTSLTSYTVNVICQKQGTDFVTESDRVIQFPEGLYAPTCYVKDVKSSGTNGGSSSVGVNQRDLNSTSGDCNWLSLSSNEFTIPSGKYQARCSAPCYKCDQAQIYLRNTTDGTNDAVGTSVFGGNTTEGIAVSDIDEQFEISGGSKTYRLNHYITNNVASDGLGVATSAGLGEVYSKCAITKLR